MTPESLGNPEEMLSAEEAKRLNEFLNVGEQIKGMLKDFKARN